MSLIKKLPLVEIISYREGDAIGEQAEAILNGDSLGNQNPNAVELIKKHASKFLNDDGVLGEQAEELMETIEGTVLCHVCGDYERRGVADETSKGWLCEECQEKFVKEVNSVEEVRS